MDRVQRNNLKRPRVGSLDVEPDRPPPIPPSGTHHAQIGPDMQLSSDARYCASPESSNRLHPIAASYSMDCLPLDAQNHQQLTPFQLLAPGYNLAIPPAYRPIPSPPSQTNIMGGNQIENHGILNFYHQTLRDAQDPCLKQLHDHATSNAIHTSSAVDNQGICMPGTRAFTLQRLQSLVVSIGNNDPDVVWMHGPAGAGKSAIMRTMANALGEQGVLLGSFFFFRSDPQRDTWNPFIPTMAFQAFKSCPATRPHIRNAIHSHPDIFSQSIRHQLHHLLEMPLKLGADHEPKSRVQPPLVIVVDGLDECADADQQIEVIKAMRRLASTIRSSTNRRVKILIASRPEKPIKDEFKLDKDSVTIIELTPSDANIDLYYDTRLDEIRRRKNLPESWPSLKRVKWLKEKTSGQYSFAHISTGFLAGGDPVERLKMIEKGVGTHGLEPFAALDALYATIFQQIPPEMAEDALLLVRAWLVHPGFADEEAARVVERILSLPAGFSLRLLPYLSSIFYIEDLRHISHFQPYHASLGDFLGDQLRATKYSLFLGLPALSTAITEGMLGLCIVPLPLPIDEETAYSWFEDYHILLRFAECTYWDEIVLHSSPLPSTAAALTRLSLLLPTMDLYTFGYCQLFFSVLLQHLQVGDHLASNPSYFHTVRRLLDQIHSIQQLRFATYNVLEARGDSGLGLFGLLVLLASDSVISIYAATEVTESSTPACRVEDVVAHLVCVDQDIRDFERNPEKPLPLCTLAHQLFTAKKLSNRLENDILLSYYARRSMGRYAVLPRAGRIKHDFPQLSLCLSQTIMMFLDLPSQNTLIQDRIQQRIGCADHAGLSLECSSCTLNLQRMQISIIYSVLYFLCAEGLDGIDDLVIDARTFSRSHRFVYAVCGFNSRLFDERMVVVGACILHKLEVGTGTDTHLIDDVRTIVSSLHKKRGIHCGTSSVGRSYMASEIPPRSCWVCSGVESSATDRHRIGVE